MKKKLLENISFNFVLRIITYIFSFLTVVYVTRMLLPEVYGRVSFASSITGYFIMFSALGIPMYGMRSCAENKNSRENLSKIFNELISVNILFAGISLFALILSIILIPALRENSLLIIIFAAAIIFRTMGCEWLFQGLEKFKFLAVATFITRLISFLCILLFVHSGKDMYIYAMLSVIAGYGSNFICFINLHKYVNFSFKLNIKKEHIKALFIFFMMSCAISVYNSLDITMLGFMTNNYETGLYAIAAKIKIFLAMTGGIVCTALLPHISALWKEEQKTKIFKLIEKLITWVCIIQLGAAIFCFIFAKGIINIIGGESYLGCVTSFRILLLTLLPIGYSNILGNLVLIPCGLERKLLKAEIIGAVVNFSANLAIIPVLAGAGAAMATLLAEIIVLIFNIYYIKRILNVDFGLTMLYKMPKIAVKSVKKLNIFILKHYRKKFENF